MIHFVVKRDAIKRGVEVPPYMYNLPIKFYVLWNYAELMSLTLSIGYV